MGSGNKGLYSDTEGLWREARRTQKYESIMTCSIINWVHNEVRKINSKQNSKGERKRFNTASIVYDDVTGKKYYGRNSGINLRDDAKNPILFGDNGILPKESFNDFSIGNCAEVDAINQALNNGSLLQNLRITTVFAIDQKNAKIGDYKTACENCTYAFKGRIKYSYSGWNKEGRNHNG